MWYDCMIMVLEISLNIVLLFNVVFDKNMCIKSVGLYLRILCNENLIRVNKNKWNFWDKRIGDKILLWCYYEL